MQAACCQHTGFKSTLCGGGEHHRLSHQRTTIPAATHCAAATTFPSHTRPQQHVSKQASNADADCDLQAGAGSRSIGPGGLAADNVTGSQVTGCTSTKGNTHNPSSQGWRPVMLADRFLSSAARRTQHVHIPQWHTQPASAQTPSTCSSRAAHQVIIVGIATQALPHR